MQAASASGLNGAGIHTRRHKIAGYVVEVARGIVVHVAEAGHVGDYVPGQACAEALQHVLHKALLFGAEPERGSGAYAIYNFGIKFPFRVDGGHQFGDAHGAGSDAGSNAAYRLERGAFGTSTCFCHCFTYLMAFAVFACHIVCV